MRDPADAKKTVQAVIFDWAGTLIDKDSTAPVHAFVELFRRHGLDIDEAGVRRSMGLLKRDHIREVLFSYEVLPFWTKFHGHPTEDTVNTLNDELESLLAEVAAHRAKPIDGVLDVIDRLRRSGVKIGSTTGYTKRTMEAVLPVARAAGLRVDCVVASDEVCVGRPAPWMIYRNMEALDVYPANRVVKVGDTVMDVKEAQSAGVWGVGVLRGGNEFKLARERPDGEKDALTVARKRMMDAGAHCVIEHISGLPNWIERLGWESKP